MDGCFSINCFTAIDSFKGAGDSKDYPSAQQ